MGVLKRRELSRPVIVGGALAGLALAVLLGLIFSRTGSQTASAHFPLATGTQTGTPHNALDFSLGANTDNNAGTGDQRQNGHGSPRGDDCVSFSKLLITATPVAPATCHVDAGANFTVSAYLNNLGGIANYKGFDISLNYTGVTLVGVDKATGSNWPSCGFPVTSTPAASSILAGCTVNVGGTPPSSYTGRIATMTFNCAANGSITMLHGAGGTDIAQPVTPTPLSENHGEVEGSSETLTIVCDYPEISLSAQSLSGGIAITCDTPTPPSTKPERCTVPVQPTATVGAFQIVVDANHIPGSYGGFNAEVLVGGLDLLSRSCLDEVQWPQRVVCQVVVSTPAAPAVFPASKQYKSRSSLFPPFPTSSYVGQLVRINVDCPHEGQFEVVMPAFPAGPTATGTPTPVRTQGAAYFDPNETPIPVSTVSIAPLDLNGDGVPDTTPVFPIADALLINCIAQPTAAPTNTPTITPTPGTPAATLTPSPTSCGGPCPTATSTNTPTITNTPGPTNTPAPTSTNTPSPACIERVQQDLTVPGKVTTNEGGGATGADQLETSVTTTGAGRVTICEKLPVLPDPPGYTLRGQQADISAPQATTARPLTLTFWLDTSVVQGATASQVQVFMDGSLVPGCSGTPNTASPNPCVQTRTTLIGSQAGDVQITVLSSVSLTSSWTFGTSSTASVVGDVNCDGHVNSVDSALILQASASLISSLPCAGNADVNNDGLADSRDALLILQYEAGLIHSLPAGEGGGHSVWRGLAGLAAWLGAK
jgi:hypothetical protein